MEKLELTVEETDLLCKTFIDGERIKSGELFTFEEEFVLQFRFAKEYLERKYPSYGFGIVSGEPGNFANASANFVFENKENIEIIYVNVKKNEDGEFEAEDDFYASLINGECTEFIKKLAPDSVGVWSDTNVMFGEKYNEKLGFLQLLEKNECPELVAAVCYVGIPAVGAAAKRAELGAIFEKNRLKGEFTVYFIKSAEGCEDVNTLRDRIYTEREELVLAKEKAYIY